MSKENVVRFVEAVRGSARLRRALAGASTPAEVIRIAQAAGYPFTPDELALVRYEAEYIASGPGAFMSREELEARAARTSPLTRNLTRLGIRGGGEEVCTEGTATPITCIKIPDDWTVTKNITCD
jgi:predicted ribosomally synthesized peptide with nif11-like leader